MAQAVDMNKIRTKHVDREISLQLIESINRSLEHGKVEEVDGDLAANFRSYIEVDVNQRLSNLAIRWISNEYKDKGWYGVAVVERGPTTKMRFFIE